MFILSYWPLYDDTTRSTLARSWSVPIQRLSLAALVVKVLRRQPPLQRDATRRPLVCQHGEPGRVAAAPLDDQMVAEDALGDEAEALGSTSRRRVQRVALPLVASVAQHVKGVPRQQEEGLGGRGGALQRGREHQVADLDGAVGRVYAQVGCVADGLVRRVRDDGEEQGVLRGSLAAQALLEGVERGIGPVAHVEPEPILLGAGRRGKESRAVDVGIQGHQGHQTTGEGDV